MPNLFFAQEELNNARESFEEFRRMQYFNPLHKGFYNFITHLDLVFIKAERGCLDIRNKFEPFQGYYKKLRRTDPLLSYLKNARDAINHDIAILYDLEIIDKRKIVDYIELSFVDHDGNKKTEKHPMFPAEIKLKKFHINNKDWVPPSMHLGIPLFCKADPSEVAYLGLKFYEDFINEIKRKFKT